MKKLYYESKDWQVTNLFDLKRKGKLQTDPDYQREYVYDEKKASKLIESALMKIPLPTLYFCEEDNGIYSVIDGQQRIESFIKFLNGEFALKGMTTWPELEGKKYSELSDEEQSVIDTTAFRTIVILKESASYKFDIFERLNTGAVGLNAQELRNCVYRGSYNALLHSLAKEKIVSEMFVTPNKRMKYEELILRFLALRNYKSYKPGLKTFLNKYMQLNQNCDIDKITNDKEVFLQTLKNVKAILGKEAFCNVNEKGIIERKSFSATYFDSIMVGFLYFDKIKLQIKSDEIKRKIDEIKIKSNNIDFYEACNSSTGSTSKIIYRIKCIEDIVFKTLGCNGYIAEKRTFDNDLKIKLLEQQNYICPICGQKILSINDAEVDHIKPYSKGGKTIESNAQVVHTICNRHKSDKFSLLDTLLLQTNPPKIIILDNVNPKNDLTFKKPELLVVNDVEYQITTGKEMLQRFYDYVHQHYEEKIIEFAKAGLKLRPKGSFIFVSIDRSNMSEPYEICKGCYGETNFTNEDKLNAMIRLTDALKMNKAEIKIVVSDNNDENE